MRLLLLYREDWIRGPKATADVQRLVSFTEGSGGWDLLAWNEAVIFSE
jgi:hypothetical protein